MISTIWLCRWRFWSRGFASFSKNWTSVRHYVKRGRPHFFRGSVRITIQVSYSNILYVLMFFFQKIFQQFIKRILQNLLLLFYSRILRWIPWENLEAYLTELWRFGTTEERRGESLEISTGEWLDTFLVKDEISRKSE